MDMGLCQLSCCCPLLNSVNLVVSTCLSFTDMFNITNMRGKVAKFCIFKTVYRLGEDVIGTFTFSEGDIPCIQVGEIFLLFYFI